MPNGEIRRSLGVSGTLSGAREAPLWTVIPAACITIPWYVCRKLRETLSSEGHNQSSYQGGVYSLYQRPIGMNVNHPAPFHSSIHRPY